LATEGRGAGWLGALKKVDAAPSREGGQKRESTIGFVDPAFPRNPSLISDMQTATRMLNLTPPPR
jgi:hypothetical protein